MMRAPMSAVSTGFDLELRNRGLVAGLCVPAAVLAFAAHSPRAYAFVAALSAAVLVVVTATDLERRIIPNKVVLPAAAVVLLVQLAVSPAHGAGALAAGAAAAAFFAVPGLINGSLVGMGDAKLALLLGFALRAKVIGALLLAFAGIFPVALFVVIRGGWKARKTSLPFGPFLAFGGLVILIAPLFN